jgi:hypothetical protein
MTYTESGKGRSPKRLHRLLWEEAYGDIPEGFQIDHINGDRTDNRLENLRLASNQDNSRNRQILDMTNIDKRGNSYRVRIMIDGKTKVFGSYDNLEAAQNRRDEVREKLFGEFKGRYD